jgi:hypothetical protein
MTDQVEYITAEEYENLSESEKEYYELEEGDLSLRTLYNKMSPWDTNQKPVYKAIEKVHGKKALNHLKKAVDHGSIGNDKKEEDHFDKAMAASGDRNRASATGGRDRSANRARFGIKPAQGVKKEETDYEFSNQFEEDAVLESMAADSLKPNSRSAGSDPKSKVEYLTAIVGKLAAAKKEDLVKWFDDTQAQFGPGKDWGVGDKSAANQSTIDMKGGKGPKTRDPMPKLSVKEDVEEMFVGQDLSEEFKTNAVTIFEAAVTARTSLEIARLEEEYELNFNEAIEHITEELSNKVDSYLEYVVETWVKDNEVAIESSLRNELAEEFIDGLKNLFAEHYIDVPQDKISVIESLADKVSELESKLDEVIEENVAMGRALLESEKNDIFGEMSEGLTLSQQEKFSALAEGIDFDGDLDLYSKKLSVVKENYFSSQQKSVATTNIEEETFEGETSNQIISNDPSVNRYVQAIARSVKK